MSDEYKGRDRINTTRVAFLERTIKDMSEKRMKMTVISECGQNATTTYKAVCHMARLDLF